MMTVDSPKKRPSPGQISWSACRTARSKNGRDRTSRNDNRQHARDNEKGGGGEYSKGSRGMMSTFGARVATAVEVDKRTVRRAAFRERCNKIGLKTKKWHQTAVETRSYPGGRALHRPFSLCRQNIRGTATYSRNGVSKPKTLFVAICDRPETRRVWSLRVRLPETHHAMPWDPPPQLQKTVERFGMVPFDKKNPIKLLKWQYLSAP